LSLVIFIDAAVIAKSVNKSMTAFFSTIAELPPNLRHASENILFHSTWYGSNPDYNEFLETFNSQTESILMKGIFFRDKKIKIRVLLFVADAPARAKGCKCSQFNGKFGCIKCLHPTIFTTKTIYPCLKTVNEFIKARNLKDLKKFEEKKRINSHVLFTPQPLVEFIGERTSDIYKSQVEKVCADDNLKVYQGIQGTLLDNLWFFYFYKLWYNLRFCLCF
jgi:hypothetical protein